MIHLGGRGVGSKREHRAISAFRELSSHLLCDEKKEQFVLTGNKSNQSVGESGSHRGHVCRQE